MADYFRTVNAPALEVPELGRLERVKLSVPVLEGVPFAIVELDGAKEQRQTLRLDLDKRRFLDLPERTEYAVASRQIAASIIEFLQREPAAGRDWAVQVGKRIRPVGKVPGKGIIEKVKGTFIHGGTGETSVLMS
ncbi:MAG TPA: hypothetical protein VN829_07885, partial [Dongiaceae bacterium]|nr:hypothetical protein [Dongiaceae bacterium]